jgi:hypothetical protein
MRRFSLPILMIVFLTLIAWSIGCGPAWWNPPDALQITSLTADPPRVRPGGESMLSATVSNPRGGELRFAWTATDGTVEGTTATVLWTAPNHTGDTTVTCTVTDSDGATASRDVTLACFT